MFCKLLVVVILAVCCTAEDDVDYCDSTLCKEGKKNIACNNKGDWYSNCLEPEVIEMTPDMIELILNQHNQFRSDIAMGNFPGFPQASRMAQMKYCKELEVPAALNVKQCNMKHDECRNTPTFRKSGQNLARYGTNRKSYNVTNIIERMVIGWQAEYTFASKSDIDSHTVLEGRNGEDIGHFLTSVLDRAYCLGCGISTYKKDGYQTFLLACNYASNNIVNRATYIAGDTASNCEQGSDSTYPGLCKITEAISASLEPVQSDSKKLLTMPPIPSGLLQARKPKPAVAVAASTAAPTTTTRYTTRATPTTTTTSKPKSTATDAPLTASQISELSSGLFRLKTKSEQAAFIDAFRKRNFA
ncbi:unnamed protein product [Diamesa serratosioi]